MKIEKLKKDIKKNLEVLYQLKRTLDEIGEGYNMHDIMWNMAWQLGKHGHDGIVALSNDQLSNMTPWEIRSTTQALVKLIRARDSVTNDLEEVKLISVIEEEKKAKLLAKQKQREAVERSKKWKPGSKGRPPKEFIEQMEREREKKLKKKERARRKKERELKKKELASIIPVSAGWEEIDKIKKTKGKKNKKEIKI